MTTTIVVEGGGCYAYQCPQCWRREGRVANDRILQVLVASGASAVTLTDPAALERRPVVGPLDLDDVERDVRLLDDDTAFAAAVAALTDESVEP